MMKARAIKSNINHNGHSRGSARKALLFVLILVMVFCIIGNGNDVSEQWLASFNVSHGRFLLGGNIKPSHIELCEYILSSDDSNDNNGEDIVVSETEEFCRNDKNFQHDLLQVFTSAALSASSPVKDHIIYRQNCGQYYDTSEDKTLLMKLPENVIETAFFTPEEVVQLCSQFINEEGEDGYYNSVNKILNEPQWTQKLIENVVRNIRTAYAPLFSNEPQVPQTEQHHRQLTSISWLEETDISSIYEQNNNDGHISRKLLATPNSDAPSHDGLDLTVIFLDDSKTIPFSSYPALIPRSTTNVQIIVQASAQDLGSVLHSYLETLVPRAKIQIQETSSLDEDTLQTMLSAQTLICLAESCSFPALARSQTTIMILNTNLAWMYDVIMNTHQSTNHPQTLWLPESMLIPVEDIDSAKPPEVLTSSSLCPHSRGRHGIWQQDLEFAANLQYVSPLDHYFGFADRRFHPTTDNPFRSPTTFHWKDNTCPIDVYNAESFCKLMSSDQDISRVMFVGDFVSMNQAYSLWKILGHEDSPKPMTEKEPNWEREIVCNGNHKILIQYVRNDMLIENDNPVNLVDKVRNCGSVYCYKWTDKYRQYHEENPNQRTIVTFNFGAHYYSDGDFENQMNIFLQTVDTVVGDRLGKDLLFFRTVSPGHDMCKRNQANLPFNTFEEYRPTVTPKYSWDLHDGFNDIADRMIRKFNQVHTGTPSLSGVQPINILDIYPMTVLRRDGHLGGKDCQGCFVANDCFYYSLPGPSDWWNHLMLSNLRDYLLSTKENIGKDVSKHSDLTALLGPKLVIE